MYSVEVAYITYLCNHLNSYKAAFKGLVCKLNVGAAILVPYSLTMQKLAYTTRFIVSKVIQLVTRVEKGPKITLV